MTQNDVVAAKQTVETFLRNNGAQNIYSSSTANSWAIYVNWTNKFISLHGPQSPDWSRAQGNKSTFFHVFQPSSNGFWIGPFSSFEIAYSFAELLRRALYLHTHEETSITSSRGVNFQPMRLF
jgi:hypothetical protein